MISGIGLHLRPGAREWFLAWLARRRPDLVPIYERLYARGATLPVQERRTLARRVADAARAHGVGAGAMLDTTNPVRGVPGQAEASFPDGSLPAGRTGPVPVDAEPLALF